MIFILLAVKFEFKCSPILCSDSVVIILYLRLQNSHCLRGTKVRIIQTLVFNRRSSEIQGTALGKCLQACPVNTGPCLRV